MLSVRVKEILHRQSTHGFWLPVNNEEFRAPSNVDVGGLRQSRQDRLQNPQVQLVAYFNDFG